LEKTTGEKPAPRGAGKWVAIGNKLVAIGGFRECFDRNKPGCEHVYCDDLFTFDVTTNKWEKKKPKSRTGAMPGGRAFLGASAYPKKKTVVFFGGARYSVNVATVKPYPDAETIKVYDDLWEYDPEADTFAQRTYTNQGPGARLGAEIAIKDDTLYLLGGYDATFKAHNDLWSYDLLTNTWQRLKPDDDPQSPSKRYIFRFELSESGREIYIFGGNYRERETIQRNDLWKYQIATNTFAEIISEKKTNMTGRTHGAAAIISDQFVIALGDIPGGGCQTEQASERQNPTNEVWSLRVGGARPDAKWSRVQIGSSPPPLKRVFYAQARDRLYVTLGFNYKCGTAGAEGAIYNTETYSLPLRQIHQALEP
jgi:N-acetylneuraminic acid mutarotase